jgi:dihydroorotate dehydrogenase (fumarate)
VVDLDTRYLGLALRSPIVASAGPHTGTVEGIRRLADAGVGAVVLPSLFEEQIVHESLELDRLFSLNEGFAEGAASFLEAGPSIVETYVARLEEAKQAVDVPVIASLNGVTTGGWLRYAHLLETSGADAIELNMYSVAAEPALAAGDIEHQQIELVHTLCEKVDVPVAVKISPYYTSLGHFVVALEQAGAAGVVLFNRFLLPDLDLETLDVVPHLVLSTPEETRLPLRWIGILREELQFSLAASSGVHEGEDVARLLLAGADVVMTTSAVLRHGAERVAVMEDELRTWMEANDYASLDEVRGAARREASIDPTAFERANYVGNLTTYTSRYLASALSGEAGARMFAR